MKKFRYNINNLDCPNCALKVENELNKNEKINNAVVNFNTKKISFESDENISVEMIEKIVKKIEPDCTVTETEEKSKKEYKLNITLLAVALLLIGSFWELKIVSKILVIISYVLLLYRPFINAIKSLIKNKTLNENALITISCIGAYIVGQQLEGAMVVVLYSIGKILEEKAVNKSRNSIKGLLEIKQDYANLSINGKIKKVDVETIKVGDILVVKKGEKVPVDGFVVKGETSLDTSSLTGESELLLVKKDDSVLSGTINMEDVIEIKATAIFDDSTVSKILELVNDATDKKAKTETMVSKLSVIYTPLVLVLAIIAVIILVLFTSIGFTEALYRGLTFLVISCPCAIAISVPLSYFTGIGVCSKNGILIKGSNYLDLLGRVNKIVFDKTGTITDGTFEVESIEVKDDAYTEKEVIDILVAGESLSNHPIAKSIMKLSSKKVSKKAVQNYKELTGKGIEFDYKDYHVKIGSKKICHNCKIDSSLHLNIDGKHIASIEIDDGIKESAITSIEDLKLRNIKTYMFTGDKKEVANEINNRLQFDEVKSEMLPQDKYHAYESIHEANDIIAFVGDGINDAPLLKRADIGISMGSIGTDAAIESSDIVIMNDDINKINKGIDISKYTTKIIIQNLVFAISTKVLILILSVFGLASMWLAVFADTGVTLLAILNTLRIMKK